MDDTDNKRCATKQCINKKLVKYIQKTREINEKNAKKDFIYSLLFNFEQCDMKKDVIMSINHLYESYFSLYSTSPFVATTTTTTTVVNNSFNDTSPPSHEKNNDFFSFVENTAITTTNNNDGDDDGGLNKGKNKEEEEEEKEEEEYMMVRKTTSFLHTQKRVQFIEETFKMILDSENELVKKFITLIIIGQEPEIRLKLSKFCPRSTVDRTFPFLERQTTLLTKTKFNKFNSESIMNMFMNRFIMAFLSDVK